MTTMYKLIGRDGTRYENADGRQAFTLEEANVIAEDAFWAITPAYRIP
jgi:hypothetical protein